MVYQTGEMILHPVREIFRGEVNDVVVCKNVASAIETYYTLVMVKDRACAKQLLSVFENAQSSLPDGKAPFVACFSHNELLCYLFDYRAERNLTLFAASQITTVHDWETAGINLVMECLSSPLPYPLLALTLKQGNIHIEKDNSVFLTPYFDLSKLNPSDGEQACARKCVETMLELLLPTGAKLKSAELMRKKLGRNAYRSLPELYKDFKVTALPPKKQKLMKRLSGAWKRHKDGLFRFLLIFGIVVAIFAAIIFISQLIFGDIPIFRLFERRFEEIGTRTLN